MADIFNIADGVRPDSEFDVCSRRSCFYQQRAKRALDLFLSVVALPFLAPLIAVLYIAVRLDGGPGFFGHSRVGRGGGAFRCWKLRTMVPDAQQRLDAVLRADPAARAEWEKDQKLRHDPRITWLGGFLRRTSLDELPQIWNVLKGEMSLIGPRPVTVPELERYKGHKPVYLALRPGITGLWQVSGRNSVSYDTRVEMDAAYFRNIGFLSDIRILFQTVGVVFARTGH